MYYTSNIFVTQYDDSDSDIKKSEGGEGSENQKSTGEKTFNQTEVNTFVEKRVGKMKAENRQMLSKFEALQQSIKTDSEGRDALETELEELRVRTLSQDEIQKRETKKVADKYIADLKSAQEGSTVWQNRYDDLRISYEINTAAAKNKIASQSLPMVESFLRPNTKLVEIRDDDGKSTNIFESVVDFADIDSEGKSIIVQMSIPDTIKRMSELPDLYGNLFEGQKVSGTGGSSGSSGPTGSLIPSKLSTEEYLKLRKENPRAALGIT